MWEPGFYRGSLRALCGCRRFGRSKLAAVLRRTRPGKVRPKLGKAELAADLHRRPHRRDGPDADGHRTEAGREGRTPAFHASRRSGRSSFGGRRGRYPAGGKRRDPRTGADPRSEEHTSEFPSLMRTSSANTCLKKQKTCKPKTK